MHHTLRNRRSEVRRQRSEVGRQRSEVRGRRSEDGRRKDQGLNTANEGLRTTNQELKPGKENTMKKVIWIMMALISPVLVYGATYTWDGSGDGSTWDISNAN